MSEKLTVAELLARNAKEGGGRSRRNAERPRRHRDLDQGGISVSELTGDIPVVVVDEDGRPTGPDPEYREHDARHGGTGAEGAADAGDGADSADEAGGADKAGTGAADAAADATGTTDRKPTPAPEPAARAASATTGTFVASDSTLLPNRPVAADDDLADDSADFADAADFTGSADSADVEQAEAATAVAPLVTPDAVLSASEYDDSEADEADEAEARDVAVTDGDDTAVSPATTRLAAQPDETGNAAGETAATAGAAAAASATATAPEAAAAETAHADDEIVEYEDDTISWGALIGQALGAVVLGVLIFFGFTVLWNHLATVLVLVMALIVTLVVVGLVHALLRHRDTLILALAFIVGLALTLGPRLIMSI
jgi:colicin import membrane protein